MTVFSTIVGAAISALEQAPAVSGSIERARTRVISEDEPNAINVFFDSASPSDAAIHGAPVDWSTRLVVDVYARGTEAAWENAIDTLLGAVVDRLMQDSTLGGLVDDLSAPNIAAEYDSNGLHTGWMRLIYTVQHRTDNNTIA